MTLTCTMILGDCLEVTPTLEKNNTHLVFADLPYGMTPNKWDSILPLPQTWDALKYSCANNYVCALTGIHPFSAQLVMSNPKLFRYDLIWRKTNTTGFLNANKRPLRQHESVLIFASARHTYMPKMSNNARVRQDTRQSQGKNYREVKEHIRGTRNGFPRSVIDFPDDKERYSGHQRRLHPTQKPISLLDWLILTYSNPGDNVLDPVSGSGTTAVSAIQNGRNVTCIEKDAGYFDASVERVRKTIMDNQLDVRLEVRR